MIFANSNIQIYSHQLKKLERAQILALEQTAEALHTEIVQSQVVPLETGNLQGDGFFVDFSSSVSGLVSLTHSTPYARRLYFHPEYNFNRSNNPHAKGKWFSDWLPGGSHAEFASQAYKRLYKNITGV